MSIFDGIDLPQGQQSSLNRTNAYPFMQWIEPDPRGADNFTKKGGFFMPADQIPDVLELPDKWLSEVHFSSGNPKVGLGFTRLYAAHLSWRLDWMVKHPDGSRDFAASYDEANELMGRNDTVQGRSRFLVLVRNLVDGWAKVPGNKDVPAPAELYGPYILTIAGTKGAWMQDAFGASEQRLLKPYSKLAKQPLPPYVFWVPIVMSPTDQPASKKPGIRTRIWPPVWEHHDKRELDLEKLAEELFVGQGVIDLAKNLWDEAQEWGKAKPQGKFGEPATGKEDGEAPFQRGGGGERFMGGGSGHDDGVIDDDIPFWPA